MFDLKLTISDLFEIIGSLTIANEVLASDDGGNYIRQQLIEDIFRQYRAQVGHPDAQIPDSIYAPDPEDFDEEATTDAD